jgi:hypothetical protein
MEPCDHIKRMKTLTSENIKRLSLYQMSQSAFRHESRAWLRQRLNCFLDLGHLNLFKEGSERRAYQKGHVWKINSKMNYSQTRL